MSRLEEEQEENKKTLEELTALLMKLEEEAKEVMKACQEAEVSSAPL